MNQKFWQTERFKQLQREWYEKAGETGFTDAEVIQENGSVVLKQNAANCYRNLSAVERDAKLIYFQLLGIHVHQTIFIKKSEKLIMERRASGVKISQICQELRQMNERCHRQTVRKVIRKYEIRWRIRKKKSIPPATA